MSEWKVLANGRDAVNTVLKGLQKARSDFVVSPYAPPRIDGANGVVWASFIIPGQQNPSVELYIEKFADYVSMRLTGVNPNFAADTRKTAKREGEIPATTNAVTRWLQQAASDFAKKVPQLRKETMSKKYPNADRLINERVDKSRVSEAVASGAGAYAPFEKGDRLSIIMSREGMKNFKGPQKFEAIALEDGSTGGWDVYDVKPRNPRLFDDPEDVSIYGFDIDKINGVPAEELDNTDYGD